MGEFCADGCLTGMSQTEQVKLISRIRRKMGAPVVGVEIRDEQIEECICEAIEEYSGFINKWVLRNRLGEMLGLPSDIDFTLKYISNSIYFERSFAVSYGEQAGLGANSVNELKTTSIQLTAGTQNYFIPPQREVNEVLWFTPAFINLFGMDPMANTNIAYSEFGASFAGHTLYHVMPVFDTILTAQAAELRNRVRGSEYAYILRPGPDGQKVLRLFPTPRNPGGFGAESNVGIGAAAGTPGFVYYTYYDRFGTAGNSSFSGYSANPGFTGTTDGNGDIEAGNGLVSTPGDAQLNYISYNQLNSVARTEIKKYAQALAKELLGLAIRGKFSGTLPIPDAELTLNYSSFVDTSRDDMAKMKEEWAKELDELSYERILEKRASMQKSINETLGYGPSGIYVY